MASWPAIDAPELRARLALDDAGIDAHLAGYIARFGTRTCDAAAVRRAFDYPWSRPARSYLLTDGAVEVLDELEPGNRDEVLAVLAREDGGRIPLLAIGSNGAPGTLRGKFAHFADAVDRTVLVLTGQLHDFDIGVSPRPTVYGALPATLFESPGTRTRCAVLWVTPAQFQQLTWSEVSYALGRLAARFTGDDPGCDRDDVLAFVSRFGNLCVGGEPAALAAIPARDRTARALTEEQLLDHAATLVLGDGARAEDLVRAVFTDMAGLAPRARAALDTARRPFASERWTPYPAA